MEPVIFWIKSFMIVLSLLSGKEDILVKQNYETNDYIETQQIITLMKNKLESQVYFSKSDMLVINAYMDTKNDDPEVIEIKKELNKTYTGLALDHQVARLNKIEVQKSVYDFYLKSILQVEENLKDK